MDMDRQNDPAEEVTLRQQNFKVKKVELIFL